MLMNPPRSKVSISIAKFLSAGMRLILSDSWSLPGHRKPLEIFFNIMKLNFLAVLKVFAQDVLGPILAATTT